MGVESGSQQVLDAMDKGLRVSEVVDALVSVCEKWASAPATFCSSAIPERLGTIFSRPSRWCAPRVPMTSASPSPTRCRTRASTRRFRAELGHKRNWTDSDDLCVMFTAEYKDEFYHALRDALHAEVDSWRGQLSAPTQVTRLWQRVADLEPVSRNPGATPSLRRKRNRQVPTSRSFCPCARLSAATRGA